MSNPATSGAIQAYLGLAALRDPLEQIPPLDEVLARALDLVTSLPAETRAHPDAPTAGQVGDLLATYFGSRLKPDFIAPLTPCIPLWALGEQPGHWSKAIEALAASWLQTNHNPALHDFLESIQRVGS